MLPDRMVCLCFIGMRYFEQKSAHDYDEVRQPRGELGLDSLWLLDCFLWAFPNPGRRRTSSSPGSGSSRSHAEIAIDASVTPLRASPACGRLGAAAVTGQGPFEI